MTGSVPAVTFVKMGKAEALTKMIEKWDQGLIISSFNEEILANDTFDALRDRLFAKSADALAQMMPAYLQGKINLKHQDNSEASYARMITKEDAFIPPKYLNAALQGQSFKGQWKIDFIKLGKKPYHLTLNAQCLDRFIRAMHPWPHAWTYVKILRNKDTQMLKLKILKTHLQPTTHNPQLILDEVQLEGKNPTTWQQFKEGYPEASFS